MGISVPLFNVQETTTFKGIIFNPRLMIDFSSSIFDLHVFNGILANYFCAP